MQFLIDNFTSAVGMANVVIHFVSGFFTLFMLINCILRKQEDFPLLLWSKMEYEKIAWIVLMIITSQFYAAGAIAYYIVFLKDKK